LGGSIGTSDILELRFEPRPILVVRLETDDDEDGNIACSEDVLLFATYLGGYLFGVFDDTEDDEDDPDGDINTVGDVDDPDGDINTVGDVDDPDGYDEPDVDDPDDDDPDVDEPDDGINARTGGLWHRLVAGLRTIGAIHLLIHFPLILLTSSNTGSHPTCAFGFVCLGLGILVVWFGSWHRLVCGLRIFGLTHALIHLPFLALRSWFGLQSFFAGGIYTMI